MLLFIKLFLGRKIDEIFTLVNKVSIATNEKAEPAQTTISINEENDLVLKKMASYCKENDIRMICVSSALPPKRLIEEDIDQFHQYFDALCDSIGVPFYDMNYAQKLDRTGADYIDKEGHMMLSLANRQTDLLCEILKSDSPEKFFYDSYSEVLKNLEGCVS